MYKNVQLLNLSLLCITLLPCGYQVKIDNVDTFHEVAGILPVAKTFATSEDYIDSRYDLHLQKIGSYYRAFM